MSEWIRAKVAAARADTRPTLTTDEVRASLKARLNDPYRTRPADDGGFYFLSGEGTPTADELEGMAWWNGLDDYERRRWMKFAGDTGRVADAWAEWKRCEPTFLDDGGPLEPPMLITRPKGHN